MVLESGDCVKEKKKTFAIVEKVEMFMIKVKTYEGRLEAKKKENEKPPRQHLGKEKL